MEMVLTALVTAGGWGLERLARGHIYTPLHTDHTFVWITRHPGGGCTAGTTYSTAQPPAATATAIVEWIIRMMLMRPTPAPQVRGQRRQAVRLVLECRSPLRHKRDLSAGWNRSGDGCSGSWCWVHYRRTSVGILDRPT